VYLQASPWKRGKLPVRESWLREAAAAFSVSLIYEQGEHGKCGQVKPKDEMVDQVVIRFIHRMELIGSRWRNEQHPNHKNQL
jgi:hypothetical protein